MADNYSEIKERANDAQRQKASNIGTGDYGGEDQDREQLRQKTMPGVT